MFGFVRGFLWFTDKLYDCVLESELERKRVQRRGAERCSILRCKTSLQPMSRNPRISGLNMGFTGDQREIRDWSFLVHLLQIRWSCSEGSRYWGLPPVTAL